MSLTFWYEESDTHDTNDYNFSLEEKFSQNGPSHFKALAFSHFQPGQSSNGPNINFYRVKGQAILFHSFKKILRGSLW